MIDFTRPFQRTTRVQRCPVCEGRGVVPKGFYNPYATFTTSSTEPDTCRTCHGSGIVHV